MKGEKSVITGEVTGESPDPSCRIYSSSAQLPCTEWGK